MRNKKDSEMADNTGTKTVSLTPDEFVLAMVEALKSDDVKKIDERSVRLWDDR